MKASKNLIRAIAALVASSVLCVGVCLAWFSANKKVDAGGFNSYAKGVNIAKFQITAYQLEAVEGNDTEYKKGEELTPSQMKVYGGLNGGTTAVLLRIEYAFKQELGKNYEIHATCKNDERSITKVAGEDKFDCYLSDAVTFYRASEAGGAVSAGEAFGFFKTSGLTETKSKNLKISTAAITDGGSSGADDTGAVEPEKSVSAVDFIYDGVSISDTQSEESGIKIGDFIVGGHLYKASQTSVYFDKISTTLKIAYVRLVATDGDKRTMRVTADNIAQVLATRSDLVEKLSF